MTGSVCCGALMRVETNNSTGLSYGVCSACGSKSRQYMNSDTYASVNGIEKAADVWTDHAQRAAQNADLQATTAFALLAINCRLKALITRIEHIAV